MTPKQYFGTDGIRGKVGSWPITADFVLKLGRAVGVVLTQRGGDGSIVIGKDTRLSGYMFESALEAGLIAAGANVRLLGPMPTPAVAYLTQKLGASGGIVISASHNPHQDNGFKFFSALGEKLSDEDELAIEQAIADEFVTVAAEKLGKASRVKDAVEQYMQFCRDTVDKNFTLKGVRLAVDCANGANYQCAPRLFAALGADVLALGNQPDGLNINKHCGSTYPEQLVAAVKAGLVDLGIAFDGDGDRVLFVDHTGVILDGDDLLFILASAWQVSGRLKGPVVGTAMSNFGLELALKGAGIDFIRSAVGDRYVHQKLIEKQGILGGETSGHILCLDRASTGDGLMSALQVIEVLSHSKRSMAEWRHSWQRLPQKTVNVPTRHGKAIVQHPALIAEREAVEKKLHGHGRVVLRASGTEAIIRVTVETEDDNQVSRLCERLAETVRSLDELLLSGEGS